MPRFLQMIRHWLDQLFCLHPTPEFEIFSEPSITIEARPPRPTVEPRETGEGTLETFSEPMITIEAQPFPPRRLVR